MRVFHKEAHLIGNQYDCSPGAYLDKIASYDLPVQRRRQVGTGYLYQIHGRFQSPMGQWYAVGEWPKFSGTIVWPVVKP